MRKFWFIAVLILSGCVTTGSRSASIPGVPMVQHYTQPYSIAVLDRITIKRKNASEFTVPVSQNGVISLPDDKTLQVQGISPAKLQDLLKKKVADFVSVSIDEFRPNRVTVIGEVYHQIHTDLTEGPMRAMDAIAAANGFTPLANTRRVKLLRENAGDVEVYELNLHDVIQGKLFNHNVLLKPGDVITVPRNFL
jgi:protein involved in polysaccharide export with SLBB domain